MKRNLIPFLFLMFFISTAFADIPTDANGNNLDSPTPFNLLPLTLGLLFAIGFTIAYFTYKNQKDAVQ